MANLPEVSEWESGIYQIELLDPVIGGVDGIDNKQAIALGNRTKYLYDQGATQNATLADHETRIGAAEGRLDTIEALDVVQNGRLDVLEDINKHFVDAYQNTFLAAPYDSGGAYLGDVSVNTIMRFSAKSHDSLSEYDETTGVFTPKRAGFYRIEANLSLYTPSNLTVSNDAEWIFVFRKNGTNVASQINLSFPLQSSSLDPRIKVAANISKIIQLNGSTDYVDLVIFNTFASSYGVRGNFNAFLIG